MAKNNGNVLIGDQMLAAVRDSSMPMPQRLENLHSAAEIASAQWGGYYDASPKDRLGKLRCAGWLACLPSLEASARYKRPDQSVAIIVMENIRTIFGEIVERESIDYSKASPQGANIEGVLTELSVLGLLWWGTANGLNTQNRAVLPATRKQDDGRFHCGFKEKADLLIYEGRGNRQAVEVKRNAHYNKKAIKHGATPHKPGTVFLSPMDITGEPRERAALLLMEAIVRNDDKELLWAQVKAENVIQEARKEQES